MTGFPFNSMNCFGRETVFILVPVPPAKITAIFFISFLYFSLLLKICTGSFGNFGRTSATSATFAMSYPEIGLLIKPKINVKF